MAAALGGVAPGSGATSVGAARTPPGADVDRGAGLSERVAAVPDGELAGLGVEVAGAQQREAHRELGAVAVEHVVAEEGVVGGVGDGGGLGEAALEALAPAGPAHRDRARDELLLRKGQHHVELRAVAEQRLGPEDVGAAGERPVGEAGLSGGDLCFDPRRDVGLGRGREAARSAGRRDQVAAEVDDRGPGQGREQLRVAAERLADQRELATGRREGAVVALVARRRPLERLAGPALVAEQELRLGCGRARVVRAAVLGGDEREHLGRERLRPLGLAHEQAERGGVDRGVVVAAARVEPGVEVAGRPRLARPFVAVGGERQVLRDPGAERDDLALVRRRESVALEALRGLAGGTGAREREQAPVLQPEVVGVLLEPLLGEVHSGEQLAATLGITDGLEPLLDRHDHLSGERVAIALAALGSRTRPSTG